MLLQLVSVMTEKSVPAQLTHAAPRLAKVKTDSLSYSSEAELSVEAITPASRSQAASQADYQSREQAHPCVYRSLRI
jgi:hypothetical protein